MRSSPLLAQRLVAGHVLLDALVLALHLVQLLDQLAALGLVALLEVLRLLQLDGDVVLLSGQ